VAAPAKVTPAASAETTSAGRQSLLIKEMPTPPAASDETTPAGRQSLPIKEMTTPPAASDETTPAGRQSFPIKEMTTPSAAILSVESISGPEALPQAPVEKKTLPSADAPAPACFGHATDYGWLSGQLIYSPFNKTMRLRYASVDQSDIWGGSVTLLGCPQLEGFKDGQMVRVKGKPSILESATTAPPYQVEAIDLLDQEGSSNPSHTP
jgi:hypothetical protein